jgi:Flp pilus assembly protein CpaB
VGLILALLAAGGVFLIGSLQGGGAIGGGPTQTVVVAKSAIPLRKQITKEDLTTLSGVSTNVTNVYTNVNDVVNLIAQIQISKDAVITKDMLARDINLVSAGGAQYLPLASGYVALTIPTSEQVGVAGHITLGDYITVIASGSANTFPKPGAKAGTAGGVGNVTKTVFTNVRVIGLGPANAQVQPATGGATSVGGATPSGGVVSSLTIEMTQCDAEYFTWFLSTMQVKYTLESKDDYLKTPPTAPDPTCPDVLAAHGVSVKQVETRYHFSTLGS